MTLLDPRLNAFRSDLADEKLRGVVDAKSFVAGKLKRIATPIASILKTPNADARQVTQALFGEDCLVFEEREGFAWVQLCDDLYVGYIDARHLDEINDKITHSERYIWKQTFIDFYEELKALDERIEKQDNQLKLISTRIPMCKELEKLGGVGFVTSTALIAAVNNAKDFKN